MVFNFALYPGLISTHWDDLNASDFEHMSGPLLYQMLKSKTQLPLHSAVRLQREDVVFLCLVENSSRVSTTFCQSSLRWQYYCTINYLTIFIKLVQALI